MATIKRKTIGEWIGSHIFPIISVAVLAGGGMLTFYLTVHDNTNDIEAMRTVVSALTTSTDSQINEIDDDIDEAITELSIELFVKLDEMDIGLFDVEDKVQASSDTLIGVSRDISTLQRDYDDLDEKIDQQLVNQQDILNAISNIGN